MSNVALRAAGLTKRYGSVRALDGLDLEVGVGEVHAFLGPNGAGKTTTIRILLGLLRKDGGEVSLLGADPWRDAVDLHRRLAYVPGDVTLWPSLTGGEIIDLLGRLRGGINASRLKALTERSAMTGFAGTGQLSKLAFRRDGAVLPACVFGIAALLAITARDLKVLYPTAASRLAVATRASANPALRFLLGRLNGTSVGAFLAARWSVLALRRPGGLSWLLGRGGPAGAAHRGAPGGRDGQHGDSPADLPLATRAQAAACGPAASRSPCSAPPSYCAQSAIPVLRGGRGCPGLRR
jgi:energy-coupling factor transporter ATP-binding protein EcfA2